MNLSYDVCGDCETPDPQWVSVNKGVLLCNECSSIHRQLGRHISQVASFFIINIFKVKHLKKSRWRPTQLAMVHHLAAAGANRFWEHMLFEPMLTGQNAAKIEIKRPERKPKPDDPMHPNKADFIREKYMFLGFFKKPRHLNIENLSHQLHACVRTGVLQTSLYLLALGANPNFMHTSKGTSPMHVACQYGQVGQLELLIAYGGDVCIRDTFGLTPIDILSLFI
ncbi:unnamed protein product [Protopolystoma xenopodis]|uniref:Arf-GAP domain-containing protein n=1 Tax=Protopolystoma xenopodis TaxID=117903 RepID=A0A448WKA5_9PLAT|nr:unnamed protein product [Protopolystoma xenopodis]